MFSGTFYVRCTVIKTQSLSLKLNLSETNSNTFLRRLPTVSKNDLEYDHFLKDNYLAAKQWFMRTFLQKLPLKKQIYLAAITLSQQQCFM